MTRLPTTTLPTLLLVGGLAAALGTSASAQSLEERVRERFGALDAATSVYARHLPSGREWAIRADEPVNTLSVIKVAAMVRAFQLAEAGRLNLDRRIPVRPEDLRGGSGLLRTFEPGLRPTLRDLVVQMIITSDNTATDMVLEQVPLADVNHMLDSLGFSETRFRTSTGALFRRLAERMEAAGPGAADSVTFAFEGDSTVWLGRTTARETGAFLQALEEGRLAGEEATAAMRAILGRQFYRSRLPRYLDSDVVVAHKTGDWPPHAGNDVGILYYDGGPLVVAAFVTQNRGDFLEVERTLGWLARELVAGVDGG